MSKKRWSVCQKDGWNTWRGCYLIYGIKARIVSIWTFTHRLWVSNFTRCQPLGKLMASIFEWLNGVARSSFRPERVEICLEVQAECIERDINNWIIIGELVVTTLREIWNAETWLRDCKSEIILLLTYVWCLLQSGKLTWLAGIL